MTATDIALMGHHPDGTPAWSVHAQAASLDEDSGELDSVQITFFRDSSPHMVVAGDHLSRGSSGSSLTGNILVEQADDVSIETDMIFWDERNKVLESGRVTIEMGTALIEAGGFHHDLEADVTMLTQGIDAHLTQANRELSVSSDTAEATTDRFLLTGNVTIEEMNSGNHYSCQQLESDPSGDSIRLSGDVSGSWNSSRFQASMVQLDHAGVRMKGDVIIDLELELLDGPDDA